MGRGSAGACSALSSSSAALANGEGATSTARRLLSRAGAAVSENLRRLLAYGFATSMGWDIGRAITTAFLVLLTGPVLLRTMRRAARKARFATA